LVGDSLGGGRSRLLGALFAATTGGTASSLGCGILQLLGKLRPFFGELEIALSSAGI
jgi:hypothetical protein